MSKYSRTKLVPQSMSPREKQTLEALEETRPEQREKPVTELDMEIECPRCNEIMELCSSFDELVYSCESCSLLLKCV